MTTLEKKVDALVRFCACDDTDAVERARAELQALMYESMEHDVRADVETKIRWILLEIGVPDALLGHSYLMSAIKLAVEDARACNAITKELYPRVAAMHLTSSSRVERAIRHAIEAAWDRCDLEVLARYFGNTIHAAKGKPTNGEFIARIANVVRH